MAVYKEERQALREMTQRIQAVLQPESYGCKMEIGDCIS